MLKLLKRKPAKDFAETNKAKLLQFIIESKMPVQGKVMASKLGAMFDEQQVTDFIRDFYEMLNHKDEIQAKIKQHFPSVITEK